MSINNSTSPSAAVTRSQGKTKNHRPCVSLRLDTSTAHHLHFNNTRSVYQQNFKRQLQYIETPPYRELWSCSISFIITGISRFVWGCLAMWLIVFKVGHLNCSGNSVNHKNKQQPGRSIERMCENSGLWMGEEQMQQTLLPHLLCNCRLLRCCSEGMYLASFSQ